MKIATWNVNSLTIRLPQVLDWLAANPVELLCLQELKLTDDKFPLQALEAAGYGHYAVVANTLAKRSQQLLVITRDKRQRLFADEGEEGLETQLINWLVNEK